MRDANSLFKCYSCTNKYRNYKNVIQFGAAVLNFGSGTFRQRKAIE